MTLEGFYYGLVAQNLGHSNFGAYIRLTKINNFFIHLDRHFGFEVFTLRTSLGFRSCLYSKSAQIHSTRLPEAGTPEQLRAHTWRDRNNNNQADSDWGHCNTGLRDASLKAQK